MEGAGGPSGHGRGAGRAGGGMSPAQCPTHTCVSEKKRILDASVR